MDIAIYYQKWNAKEKNSHTLLEQAVRRYARENALLLPETLILASAEQKKKPRFQNAESIHFSISHRKKTDIRIFANYGHTKKVM